MTNGTSLPPQPLTITTLTPRLSSGDRTTIDTTSIPTSWLTNLGGVDAIALELDVTSVAVIRNASELGPAAHFLLDGRNWGSAEVFYPGSNVDSQARFNEFSSNYAVGGSFEEEVRDFCSYMAYGEAVLIEESPPRRTSAAAVSASRLASGVIMAGAPTSAFLAANADGSPMMLIVGAAITVILATAGAGITLISHWLAKRGDF
jgi:hypothetical protein